MAAHMALIYRWVGHAAAFVLFSSLLLLVSNLNAINTTLDVLKEDKTGLRSGPTGTFRIAIFSDLHFGEEEHGWGIDQDVNTTRVIRSVLEQERPALVVLNGDLVTGENTFRENASDYVHQIVMPMVEQGIPWASTYGNHDSQFNLSREDLLAQEQKYRLSLTHRDDHRLPGATNYWLQIEGIHDLPSAILWFVDSRGGCPYQSKPGEVDYVHDWVAPETVDWFRRQSALLEKRNGQALPSLVFTHIPPHVYRQRQKIGLDAKRFPGLHEDDPLDYQGKGSDDNAFVQALSDLPKIHSIFTGHDHGDSWCSTWPSSADAGSRPFLCFAKHTGYGGYGNWQRGARVVELDFSDGRFDVSTWVRMEDGVVVTRVDLNETYGLDEYSTETGEEA